MSYSFLIVALKLEVRTARERKMNPNLHQAQSHDILRSWQSQRNDVNHPKDFVLPMFIGNGDDSIEPIDTMPEVYRYGCNKAIEYLDPLVNKFGLRSVLLFPVVTKTDRIRLDDESISDEDGDENVDDDDNEDANEIMSHSTFSSTSSDDDENERRVADGVRPERLLPMNEDSMLLTPPQSAANMQNPFLEQNEEEEDHLLGNNGGSNLDTEPKSRVPAPPMPAATPARIPPPPLVGGAKLRIVSRTEDVKLIKGMALKDKHNPVMRLIPRLREKFPNLLIICDVCLCAFTSTGHCCLFEDHTRVSSSGTTKSSASHNLDSFPISNKLTCQYLAMLSVEYALRGCNVVAPSDMMDGRILTIREKLNENRLHHVSIMSYSAKFASALYGPFRQATENAPEFGDRRAYQLPPGSRALALKAVQRDISQGADIVMVKPAGFYLDIVRDIRELHQDVPIAVYQVSGEYSMLKVAAKNKIIDLKLAANEALTAYRRAGATIIISYFTPELLRGEMRINDF